METKHFSILAAVILSLALYLTKVPSASADVLEVISNTDSNTKITTHTLSSLNPAWLRYDFNDSGWPTPSEVWWWEYWYNSGIHPTGEWINPTADYRFMNRDNPGDPKVIQATANTVQPPMTRNFVRKKFTLPSNARIDKAYLYVATDNHTKFWLNGNSVIGNGNSLDSHDYCGSGRSGVPDDQIDGGIWTFDVKSRVRTGNNLLAANILNTTPCDFNTPTGVQFLLRVEYTLIIPTQTPTPTPTRVPTATPTPTPTPTSAPAWIRTSGGDVHSNQ